LRHVIRVTIQAWQPPATCERLGLEGSRERGRAHTMGRGKDACSLARGRMQNVVRPHGLVRGGLRGLRGRVLNPVVAWMHSIHCWPDTRGVCLHEESIYTRSLSTREVCPPSRCTAPPSWPQCSWPASSGLNALLMACVVCVGSPPPNPPLYPCPSQLRAVMC
jgi:hypothetical protein